MEEGNVIVLQYALPSYRIDFFERLYRKLGSRFKVYYSPTDMGALTQEKTRPEWAKCIGQLRAPISGVEWQEGALSIPIRRGDVVILMGARSLTNLLTALRARLVGAQTIWWGHYWSSTSKNHRFVVRMLLMKLGNALLFYTDQEIEEYRRGYGARDRRPIGALNNGINVVPIQALRKEYRAADRAKAIVFIGRFTEKSGLKELLEALADSDLHDVVLEVLGDGPEAPSYRAFAHSLGISDRIIWHGGTVDEEKIAPVMNRCRLFVYPGGVGLSLIHAMAYGLPAIVHSNRWQHMPEIAAFSDGETGICFQQHHVESLVMAIRRAINSENSLDKWSMKCIERADSVYNTEFMSRRFVEFIDGLLK